MLEKLLVPFAVNFNLAFDITTDNMLRNAIRRGAYEQRGLYLPPLRFVCTFCQHVPRRLNSTANVYHLKDSPSKPDPEAMSVLLQRDTKIERRVLRKEKRQAKALQKSKEKSNETSIETSIETSEEKSKEKAKGKSTKEKTRRTIRKSIEDKSKEMSPKKSEESGMSMRTAMKPRGTTVLREESGLSVHSMEIEPIVVENQPDVATLSHGLDRVLFNPGVVYLQDPRSRVFNFDPYLQQIMPITEFDFDAVAAYVTSSQDTKLESMMKTHGKKYMGSTSSMTSVLSHFHYLLSAWRPLNLDTLSKSFSSEYRSFTQLSRLPTSIFLRYKGNGTYAIDSDKEWDGENILSFMGRSMEKLLTLPPETFEKYRHENSHTLSEEDRNAPETYHYSTFGDFMMRSQLDAHDPRLPGSGMFDLKTRAVVAVRVDVGNFPLGAGYQIKTRTGNWESFEREYFDMIRAAFLKYSMQVRMGRMDGIFVAFHNTEKIFGFQYISLDEMDAAIHEGPNSGIGEQEFKMSLLLLNKILDQAIERFPEKSLRIHFETRETTSPYMYIFAEPMDDDKIEEIQKGERGTVEEFMEKIKEKIHVAKETLGVAATEPEVTVDEDSVEETEEQTVSEDGMEEPDEQTIVDDAVEESEEKTIVDDAAEESEEQTIVEDAAEESEDHTTIDDVVKESDDEVDEAFLSELQEQRDADEKKDLFAVTLSTKSFVNGVEVLRPNHLNKDDKWEVEYSIGEFSSLGKAWVVYNALRLRQKKVSHSRLTSTDPEQLGSYHQYIRSLSSQGRDWEKHQSILDAGKATVVYKPTADK